MELLIRHKAVDNENTAVEMLVGEGGINGNFARLALHVLMEVVMNEDGVSKEELAKELFNIDAATIGVVYGNPKKALN